MYVYLALIIDVTLRIVFIIIKGISLPASSLTWIAKLIIRFSQKLPPSNRAQQSHLSMASKRKYSEENRQFNEDWTNEFLMVENRGKGMVCLVCDETLKTLKRANAKTHYKKHASTYDSMTNEMRRERIAALVQQRKRQQSMMQAPSESAQKAVLASYKIAHVLMKRGKYKMQISHHKAAAHHVTC